MPVENQVSIGDRIYHAPHLTYPGRFRQSVSAEHCHYLQEFGQYIPKKFLEVGSSSGFTTEELAQILHPNSTVIGIDLDAVDAIGKRSIYETLNDHQANGHGAHSKPQILTADGYDLPFAKHSFDGIIALNNFLLKAIEYSDDPNKLTNLVNYWLQFLKPNGVIILGYALPSEPVKMASVYISTNENSQIATISTNSKFETADKSPQSVLNSQIRKDQVSHIEHILREKLIRQQT